MRLFRRGRAGILSRGDKLTARYGSRAANAGVTALMRACEKGHIECARLLVEKGADVNAQTKSSGNCVSVDAVASDPDSALCWAAPDP